MSLPSTGQLQTYTPRSPTTVDGGDKRYLYDELQRISVVLNQLTQATQGIGSALAIPHAAFSVHKNGTNQTGVASASYTTVTWSTELYDVGGYFASNAWTPPAGKVSFQAAAYASGTLTSGSLMSLAVYKNGTILRGSNTNIASVGAAGMTLAFEDITNGSDVYDLRVYITLSSGTATITGAAANTFFTGHWISE